MVHNVTAANTAWKASHGEATTWHSDSTLPLEHQWREVGLKLTAAGGTIIAPCSGPAIAQMKAELARLTATAPAPEPRIDPMLEREADKFYAVARHYQELFYQIEKRKKQLADPRKAILLRILGINEITLPETPERCISRLFGEQRPPNHPGQLSLPRADTAEAYRYASRLVADAAVPLERTLDQLRVVDDWESQEHYPATQQRLLTEAIFRRFEEFQQTTVRNLMLKLTVAEERLAALERKPAKRRKRK